jgi:hypothetical protein
MRISFQTLASFASLRETPGFCHAFCRALVLVLARRAW